MGSGDSGEGIKSEVARRENSNERKREREEEGEGGGEGEGEGEGEREREGEGEGVKQQMHRFYMHNLLSFMLTREMNDSLPKK